MPAGPTPAPGAFPGRFAGLGGLPHGKVQRIFFFFAGGHPCAGEQLIQTAAGESAIGGVGPHPEVDVARRRGIGRALLHQFAAEFDDLGDVVRGAGFRIGALHAQAVHIFVKGVNIGLGHFAPVALFFLGTVDNFVVHIGEVAYKQHLEPQVAQMAGQHVKDQGGAGVADVAVVVGRDAADVHLHLAGAHRHKRFFFSTQRVVDLHGCPLRL